MEAFQLLYYDTRDVITDFFILGGPLMPYLAAVILLMWLLLFERMWFFAFSCSGLHAELVQEWHQRSEHRSWYAIQIRDALMSRGDHTVRHNIRMIETCFILCPLLGLMGTVTGMIDVFHIMAISGGGDPKPMANGVSRATLPVLSGMVGALSGYAGLMVVNAQAHKNETLLESEFDCD